MSYIKYCLKSLACLPNKLCSSQFKGRNKIKSLTKEKPNVVFGYRHENQV